LTAKEAARNQQRTRANPRGSAESKAPEAPPRLSTARSNDATEDTIIMVPK
jgi:hypothetical protein